MVVAMYGNDYFLNSEYGISRSATIVLAYVMQSKKLSLSSALEFVKERKPDIRY